MHKFSQVFNINKTQAELDFVDIDTLDDTPLYVDPYALTTRDDLWTVKCHESVVSFFQAVLDAVKNNDKSRGIELLSKLGEPEETFLGVSQGGNRGRGIGTVQVEELYNALSQSSAAQTGLLEDLSDFALFIPGIGKDKISDITTNVIRFHLIEYTQKQCELHEISTRQVSSGFYWSSDQLKWLQGFVNLPVKDGQKFLLVPKYMVRYQVGVDHGYYRRYFVLEFLREEHLKAGTSLVTTIKNKKGQVTRRLVYVRDVDNHYPKDKEFLSEFSQEHPEIIDAYRDRLKESASKIPDINGDNFEEKVLAVSLRDDLVSIPKGGDDASNYHDLCMSILSFLFFPNLIYPVKEAEINQGRKRIDICYTNGKESGIFYRLAIDNAIKANLVHVECKNYTKDIANPELDQLIGRFDSNNRGRFGLMLFRDSQNKQRVIERCRDAASQGHGIILPMDDDFFIRCLAHIENGDRAYLDNEMNTLYTAVIS